MNNTAKATLIANLRQYKTPTTKDAYERGFDRGFNCASWQNLPEVGEVAWTDDGNVTVTEENQWDIVSGLAYDGESNDRQYSPFEFTTSEFNKARNSEARWSAFDAGIALADMIRQANDYAIAYHQPAPFGPAAIAELATFCRCQNSNFMRDRWLDYIAGECGKNGGKVKAA